MELFLGIDIGTGSARAGIFSRSGASLGFHEEPFPLYTPHSGWAEQSPDDWWAALGKAVRTVVTEGGFRPADIAGISFDTTSCTVVVSGEDMVPLRPAIMWMDMRASGQAKRIAASGHPMLKYNGYGPVSAEWFPSKVLWLKENEPEVYHSAARIYECTDWITYKLTGAYTASLNHASCRWYYNSREGGYPTDFYETIGLGGLCEKLPKEVLPMGAHIGPLTAEAAAHLGLCAGIPVGEGGADAFVGVIGLNAILPGKMAMITGSSHLHVVQTEHEVHRQGMWGGYPDAIVPGLFMMEGGQTSTGSIINWIKNQLCGDYRLQAQAEGCSVYDILNREAEKLPIGADGLVALDFFQGNRTPHVDSDVRGLYYGLSLGHTPAHMYRASVESVCFGTKAIMDVFSGNGMDFQEIVVSGGIVKSPFWLQAHADVSNVPLTVPRVPEAPCLGSAILGAVAGGAFGSITEAANAMVRPERVVMPDQARHEAYMFYFEKYRELYQLLKDWMHAVTNHGAGKER